ncbi:hypothetical protein [Nonomuraea aridisoli]|uniref:Uncharacterized protein n=1 Tax=Nonomuraea aridisoli TaxID=2070368 RepID=A0A2W2DES6_9ACTN|nr:hypothetical protein [Nonomuraea aridisoli]PZG08921.1 hypothetical protein C1J01_38410 [Nonomuraea aridisoli]
MPILDLDFGTLALAAGIALSALTLAGFGAAVFSIRRDDRRGVPAASAASPRRFRRRVLGTYTPSDR